MPHLLSPTSSKYTVTEQTVVLFVGLGLQCKVVKPFKNLFYTKHAYVCLGSTASYSTVVLQD